MVSESRNSLWELLGVECLLKIQVQGSAVNYRYTSGVQGKGLG